MSGVYRDTLENNVGCDSFLILNLLVKRTDTVQVYDTLCNNLPKTFNSQNLLLAGTYRDTLTNNVGCDSHIFYHFIPKPIYETPLTRAICANDSSLFGGKYRKLAGVYYDTLKTIRNCDSVLKLTLTINPLDTNKQTQSICRGKSYNFYSRVLTSQGTYSHKFTNSNGCDSLILMTLSVIDSSTYSFSRMLCSGQSFPFNNQNLTQTGVYRDTFMNYLGCDSFVTLNLSFSLVLYDTLRQTVCAGQVFRTYTNPGTYYETFKSNQGCDSILTIYLKHLPATEYKTIQHSKCGAFRYGSSTYTQNDSFTETIKNYLNCDSIVTKHFVYITEPQPIFLADKTIEFCEEIMHRGHLKTTSFFTHDTIKSLEYPYCDSLYQPYYYRRESRPTLSPITKQIDTVIKGETTNIQVSGAQNYQWSTGEQSSSIRPQITEDKTFEVTTWNLADCEEKMQFSIYVIDQPLIDFPTAFSPNGDGLNDYFTPDTNGNITIDYFQIYNRWGEKVYEHSSLSKGWDGSYLGKPAANGLYTYTLRYSYLGRYFTRSGEVMMMR
jgi:gliding motility-associated-like protein